MVSLTMARSAPVAGWVVGAIISLVLVSPVSAVDQTGCSSQNTGSDSQVLYSIYNSAGKCQDHCKGGYAFAVVQADNCWCSDVAPGDTVSVGQCSKACPGWPYEKCGSEDSGLFGYIALGKDPVSTQGASTTSQAAPTTSQTPSPTPETTETTPTTTSTPTSTSTFTSTPTSTSTSTTPTTSSKKTPTSTPTTTSTSASSTSWTAIPFQSVRTVQGGVQTITVTPTAPPEAAQTSGQLPETHSQDGFWNSTGKVAGTFTVVGIVIAALIGAAIFFFIRRRNSQRGSLTINSIDDDAPTSSNGAPYMVDRRRSNLTLATGNLGGLTRGSSHDKSPNEKTPGSLSRRGSIPMNHDQRLNPAALFNTNHPNGSHASVATFRDDQDYSRPVLHVRNPDSPERDS